ncbi:hypothetical protein [Nocardia sp. NPDC051750]|uniref:hypothetical protein n=1 Tax=Nocardia sp. NPDC051750 TaxID=3364325 RepID=UPI0037A0EA96
MNAAKPKPGDIKEPEGTDPRSKWVAEAPKTSKAPAEPLKRLTVDIAADLHKAMSYAKTDTGMDLRELTAAALAAYAPVAKHLPTEKK